MPQTKNRRQSQVQLLNNLCRELLSLRGQDWGEDIRFRATEDAETEMLIATYTREIALIKRAYKIASETLLGCMVGGQQYSQDEQEDLKIAEEIQRIIAELSAKSQN